MIWLAIILGGTVLFFVVQFVALGVVLASADRDTRGLGYFGRPVAERRAFRERLRRQARALSPILALMRRFAKFTFDGASFEVDGLRGPRGTCTEASFEEGAAYSPGPEDVFVVTQMKCGTTWMQHVVYEVLMRGRGDLVERGAALYAIAPWLESVKSVSMAEAPLVGSERPSRLIKTHFPVTRCPLADDARYIYVARHPVSCFASCADFIAQNAGRLSPELPVVEEWFCSDDMWWGPWTAHVEGWWAESLERPNVLFVHFEDMKSDLASVVRVVGDFLGMRPLDDDELGEVVRKCGFAYMSENAEAFEMHPPHLIATDAELFLKGTADRHRDVDDEVRARVGRWVATEMKGARYPLFERYPDLA